MPRVSNAGNDVYRRAHGWGLAWYEQQPEMTFVKHQIMGTNSSADLAKYGPVAFSEPHSLQVVDMDGDNIPDDFCVATKLGLHVFLGQ